MSHNTVVFEVYVLGTNYTVEADRNGQPKCVLLPDGTEVNPAQFGARIFKLSSLRLHYTEALDEALRKTRHP
jgi:hypothetical protein